MKISYLTQPTQIFFIAQIAFLLLLGANQFQPIATLCSLFRVGKICPSFPCSSLCSSLPAPGFWFFRGHYITNPNKAPFKPGNPLKPPYICVALFDPPKTDPMIPVRSSPKSPKLLVAIPLSPLLPDSISGPAKSIAWWSQEATASWASMAQNGENQRCKQGQHLHPICYNRPTLWPKNSTSKVICICISSFKYACAHVSCVFCNFMNHAFKTREGLAADFRLGALEILGTTKSARHSLPLRGM